MLEEISVCLTALYLRGLSRPINVPRRRWVQVVSNLRTAECSIADSPAVLRKAGLWEEAILLETDELIRASKELVSARSVLTAVEVTYPARWLERLGQSAPPALWIKGAMPESALLGIVGSRQIEPHVKEFAVNVGGEAVRLGFSIVSGGADGCDRAGAAGAVARGGQAVEILPYGINGYVRTARCGLSVCAPDDVFNTAAAMERNTLIYAASEQTVVVQARFKEGGHELDSHR